MIGIYKIENQINHKVYIGKSIHLERRLSEHCFPSANQEIDLAIKKDGINNFNFQILEECSLSQLSEREQYYIHKYNCIKPNGYNIVDYSDNNITHYSFYDEQIINNIIDDLQNNLSLSLSDIANKYGINVSNISRINKGETHIQENLQYPLRQVYQKNKIYCQECGKEIFTRTAKYCIQCYDKIYAKQHLIPLSREELKFKIRTTSFLQIGKQFNVSDNAIRK